MLFWNSLAISIIPLMMAIWSLVPLPFLNPAWTPGKSQFTYRWSLVGEFWPLPYCGQYFGHLMRRTDCLEKTDAEKDWRQEEKGTTEDKMVGSHHQFSGHEFEQAPGDGEGQRSLMCCSPWGYKESDMTERLKTELKRYSKLVNVTTKAQTHRYREQI